MPAQRNLDLRRSSASAANKNARLPQCGTEGDADAEIALLQFCTACKLTRAVAAVDVARA
jgi:hypothetical protein